MLHPVAETKILALMVAGAAFALAGIILLVRRNTDHGSARIEILGQKFQVGSAGLVVFMIGAMLLASPLLIPASDQSIPAPASAANTSTDLEAMPLVFEAEEKEPNDLPQEATSLHRVTSRAGTVAVGDEDWFKYEPDVDVARIGVEVDGEIQVYIYDASRDIVRSFTASGSKSEVFDAASTAYFVSVNPVADESYYSIWVMDSKE